MSDFATFAMVILGALPALVVGLCVYGVMRNKMIDSTNKAYFKGREDARRDMPKDIAHLEKLRKAYSADFDNYCKETNYAYKAGIIDGVFSVLRNDGDSFAQVALAQADSWHLARMDKQKTERYERYLNL